MTKLKCSNCERKHDVMHMICECSDCYIKGAVKEQLRERERVKELMEKLELEDGNWCDAWMKLKARIEGEK